MVNFYQAGGVIVKPAGDDFGSYPELYSRLVDNIIQYIIVTNLDNNLNIFILINSEEDKELRNYLERRTR
jgi:hypothetical protein